CQHLQSIVELCRRVLVGHDTGRVAAAAQVDTNAGIAGAGKLGVDRVVATSGHIVLAVGNVLENSGNSIITEVFGQSDAGGEFDPIVQWDAGVFDDAHRSGILAVTIGRSR